MVFWFVNDWECWKIIFTAGLEDFFFFSHMRNEDHIFSCDKFLKHLSSLEQSQDGKSGHFSVSGLVLLVVSGLVFVF